MFWLLNQIAVWEASEPNLQDARDKVASLKGFYSAQLLKMASFLSRTHSSFYLFVTLCVCLSVGWLLFLKMARRQTSKNMSSSEGEILSWEWCQQWKDETDCNKPWVGHEARSALLNTLQTGEFQKASNLEMSFTPSPWPSGMLRLPLFTS